MRLAPSRASAVSGSSISPLWRNGRMLVVSLIGVSLPLEVLAGLNTRHDTPPSHPIVTQLRA